MTSETKAIGLGGTKPRIECHGEIRIGEVALECAILNDGRRGFMQKHAVKALGFKGGSHKSRFEAFRERVGLDATLASRAIAFQEVDVVFPSHGTARWISDEVFELVVLCGARASRAGILTRQQAHIGRRCEALADGLLVRTLPRTTFPHSPPAQPSGIENAYLKTTVRRRYLYLADYGHVTKIGISVNPKLRARNLELSSGRNLSRLFVAGPFREAQKVERLVLSLFPQERISGSEWINLSAEIVMKNVGDLRARGQQSAIIFQPA